MKKLLQIVAGRRISPLLRALGRRYFSGSTEEVYAKRNYANNVSEYNTVINSLIGQRRHYLLRDVYDDMMLDGVQPSREIFHSLIVGTMRGARFQDAFFFRDQMKILGFVPDAICILEEMKINEVKPTGQTYICLLNACAASGRIDRVYAIVRDMTAAGLGLNKFCYAGLIAAHKNKIPLTDDTASKIIELVEQSKGWSSVEASKDMAENVIIGVSEEELYNIPTADYVHRRGRFFNRQLTVYHVALHACADLRNVEAMETIVEMLKKDGKSPDFFLTMQTMRCYLHSGNLDRGLQIFEEYMNSGEPAMVEVFLTFIEGAMVGHTPKGMELAQDTLVKMNAMGFFLGGPTRGSDLLLKAAGEKTGGYTTANYIWDLMQAQKINPLFPAVEAYYHGLKERQIPEDDARLKLVSQVFNYKRRRNMLGIE